MLKNSIKTAIIPVAGLGTRFLPATKAQPKEMLTVVDKPVIQYIVEEAVVAGIKNIIFVTSHTKRAIEDHFDRNFELEYRLEQKKMKKDLEDVARIGKLANFAFVRQAKPCGDGDAILAALPFVQNQAFAVLFGDDIIDAKVPGIRQLIDVHNELGGSVIAVETVPKKDISRYGVLAGKKISPNTIQVSKFVEKPKPEEAPSQLGVIGRYVVAPEIANFLPKLKKNFPKNKELRLADAFIEGLKNNFKIFGTQISGTRYDCGNKLGFLEASVALGLKHPEIKKQFFKFLKKTCKYA